MAEQENRNPVEELAESFLKRYRQGERPSITEYVDKHPELGEKIRELFPALVVMEEIGAEEMGSGGSPSRKVTPDGRQLEQIGDYRIIREIGHGGMGVVYEAEQESLGRHVALKVLPHWAARDSLCLQRFRREARSAARLHHTNIVPVHEVGEAQGIHYYAMQYIQGQSLDEILLELRRLRKKTPPASQGAVPSSAKSDLSIALAGRLATGRLPAEGAKADADILAGASGWYGDTNPKRERGQSEAGMGETPVLVTDARVAGPSSSAVRDKSSELSDPSHTHYYRSVARVGLQVAEALAYAHAQKVLHRDIKPSNLLLDLQGAVWVTDFGLAKEEGEDLTQTGDLVGTLRYMAPERFSGRCDTRSDIYSLGLTLYELLALQPPYRESDRGQLIKQITTTEPPSLGLLDRYVPRDLETIVLKAIAKEPERRYQDAEGLADDLRRFLSDRPILARRTSTRERLWRWCRRNPAVASMSLGLAVMGVLLCIGSVVAVLWLSRAAEQARRAERQAQEDLFESLFVQAHASRTSQRPGQRLDGLKALAQAARLGRALGREPGDLLKLRNEAIACLALPDVQLERAWDGNPPGTNGLGFDSRFERYAWSVNDEGLRIGRVSDQQELMRLPTLPAERVGRWLIPRFSPDGRFLAVWYAQWTSRRPVQVWDLDADTSKPLFTLADSATQPEFSPDGTILAIGLPDKSVCLFAPSTGRESQRLSLDLVPERLAFDPNGGKLAVSSIQPPQVEVRDLKDGRVLYSLPHPAGIQGVAWHPQGRVLATACDDHRIYLWDGGSGGPRGVLEGHGWEVHDLAFDRTGEWLASFGWDMTLRLWELGTRKQLWHLEDVRVVAFRHDEPLMAAGISGGLVRLWTCVPSGEFRVVRQVATGRPQGFDFSPDSRWLGVGTVEGGTSILDIASKREVGSFADARYPAFDTAGRLFFVTKQGELMRQSMRQAPNGDGGRLTAEPAEVILSSTESFEPGSPRFCPGDPGLLAVEVFPPHASAQMFALNGMPRRLWVRSVPNMSTNHLSPDGRWWAIGTVEGGRALSILDTHTGELVKDLTIGDAYPCFSPDSRWLVTTTGRLTVPGGECCLWRTGSWEKVLSRPLGRNTSSPASLYVSPDGASVAVDYDQKDIKLLTLETLEEIATLTSPEPGIILGMGFSPDGRYLGVMRNNTVNLWDLQALRRGLAAIEMDWEPVQGQAGIRRSSVDSSRKARRQ
jgi:serine/threonine protein kinase/WD40 repeat protein